MLLFLTIGASTWAFFKTISYNSRISLNPLLTDPVGSESQKYILFCFIKFVLKSCLYSFILPLLLFLFILLFSAYQSTLKMVFLITLARVSSLLDCEFQWELNAARTLSRVKWSPAHLKALSPDTENQAPEACPPCLCFLEFPAGSSVTSAESFISSCHPSLHLQ